MYEMKEEFLVGVESIDNEHRELFRIAEEAMTLYKDDYVSDKYDNIVALLKELKDYATYHFASEEAYMESINYKKIFTQKIEHKAFIDKVNEINLDDLDENQDEYILEILNFLNDWLANHILATDKQIGQQ